MGAYFVQRGHAQAILPFIAHAVDTMPVSGRAGLAAKALTQRTRAMLEYHAGDLAAAAEHAREALRWAGRAGDASTALACLTVLGNALLFAGDPAAARPHFEQALRRAQAQGDTAVAASASNGLAMVERADGRFEEALAYLHQSARLDALNGNLSGQIVSLINAGNIQTLQERWPEARRTNEDALALAVLHRIDAKLAILHTVLAEIALETDDLASARPHIDAAFAAEPASGDGVVPTQLRLMLARLEAAEGRIDAAGRALAEATLRAQRSGSSTMQLSCVNAAADLLGRAGDGAAALPLWQFVAAHPRATHSLRSVAERGLVAIGMQAATAMLPAAEAARVLDELMASFVAQPIAQLKRF